MVDCRDKIRMFINHPYLLHYSTEFLDDFVSIGQGATECLYRSGQMGPFLYETTLQDLDRVNKTEDPLLIKLLVEYFERQV